MSPSLLFLLFTLLFSICVNSASSGLVQPATNRTSRRIHIPFLGLGPKCTGCPEHFCDDDPAIVQGYCCGCAGFFDSIPVQCSPQILCPLNTYDLCESYEYMMHCCC